jgi:hypothetical protein
MDDIIILRFFRFVKSKYTKTYKKYCRNLSLDRSVYLATEAMDMHFTADGIVSLKAKSKKGSVYDEVYVDDDALYDLIIQTFYTEEQSEGESK